MMSCKIISGKQKKYHFHLHWRNNEKLNLGSLPVSVEFGQKEGTWPGTVGMFPHPGDHAPKQAQLAFLCDVAPGIFMSQLRG